MDKRKFVYLLTALIVSILLASACGPGANQAVKPTASGTATATASSSPSGSATPTPFVCDGPTSAKILADVKAYIDANFTSQNQHINFEMKGCVLILSGWSNNGADWLTIVRNLGRIQNVSGVNYNDFYESPNNPLPRPVNGQCAAGYAKCGDFCIPETDKCNITAEPVDPHGTPAR